MKKQLLALAIVAAPFAANAGELSNTWVELGYAQATYGGSHDSETFGSTNYHTGDTRPKGGYLNGSVELGETPFYIFGGYSQGSDQIHLRARTGNNTATLGNFGYSVNEYNLGLGYAFAINNRMNLLTETSYVGTHEKYKLKKFRNDAAWINGAKTSWNTDSLRFAMGVDAMMTDSLEGWAKINYTQTDWDNYFGTDLGLQYKFNKTWGVTGTINYDFVKSSGIGYGVGVRASF